MSWLRRATLQARNVVATWRDLSLLLVGFPTCNILRCLAINHKPSFGYHQLITVPMATTNTLRKSTLKKWASSSDLSSIILIFEFQGPVQRILITSGLFEVNQLLHFDVKTRFIYFLSNQADPKEQNIYKISVDHPGSDPKCLTCHQTIPKCLFYSAQFSPLGGRCFLNCLGKLWNQWGLGEGPRRLGPRLPTSCILKIDKDEWMCSEMINLWDDDEKVRFDPENFEFRYEYAKTRNGDDSKN